MLSFKKEEEKIKFEMKNLDKELNKLNLELKDLKEDNSSLKRKNDYSALEKGIKAEKEIIYKIKFRLNEISKLKKKLKDLEIEKEESKVIKKDMDKVLDLINQGYTRPQAAKKSTISLSQISKWYSDGKENKSRICIYFYNQMNYIEDFSQGFFDILKKEFTHQNKISLMRSFVPKSYPKRLDRFYREDSKLWFSRLELRKQKSIYYFSIKGDTIPRLILIFDSDIYQSNFRLFDSEVWIRLEMDNVNKLKNDFKIMPVDEEKYPNQYYLSIGKLYDGELSKNLELLISNYGCYHGNYLERMFKVSLD
ncbi:hypothetical protein [Methanobrevibacter sp.]|uniref:hypothetical protein n=1 Tax=Methanobrevibacter sp. TaxID=66852 RepID=UPI00386AFE58